MYTLNFGEPATEPDTHINSAHFEPPLQTAPGTLHRQLKSAFRDLRFTMCPDWELEAARQRSYRTYQTNTQPSFVPHGADQLEFQRLVPCDAELTP